MIEFRGRISGAAEKRFIQKERLLGQNLLLFSMLVFLPIFIVFAIRTQYWALIFAYVGLAIAVLIIVRLPFATKNSIAYTPTRIYTEEECIISVGEKYEETKLISDVSVVRDHGNFYELVFPFGNVSNRFICQKDLLTQGTLAEFEALFEGKIERLTEHKK